MTREELEKEAEENSFRYTLDKPWACEVERKQIMVHFEKGYLASAEPREKRIAELKAQIEKMKSLVISERDKALRVEDVITYEVLKDIIDKWEEKENG